MLLYLWTRWRSKWAVYSLACEVKSDAGHSDYLSNRCRANVCAFRACLQSRNLLIPVAAAPKAGILAIPESPDMSSASAHWDQGQEDRQYRPWGPNLAQASATDRLLVQG